MSLQLRSPEVTEVNQVAALVNQYASQNIMLPRTPESVTQTLDDWLIAVEPDPSSGRPIVIGCGALVALTEELVEIRSLAVAEGQQGKRIGAQIVLQLVEMARKRRFSQVCALTLSEGFFLKLGFDLVDRWSISPKVWQACIYCPKFHRCDEVAVLMHLTGSPATRKEPLELSASPAWNGLLKWKEWQPLKLAYKQEVELKELDKKEA
ncbi:MAG: GNAT family N-acetyltransferase [Chloroflexota bacterium]